MSFITYQLCHEYRMGSSKVLKNTTEVKLQIATLPQVRGRKSHHTRGLKTKISLLSLSAKLAVRNTQNFRYCYISQQINKIHGSNNPSPCRAPS